MLDHSKSAALAKTRYVESLKPAELLADWQISIREARKIAADALRASKFMTDIATALKENCGHSIAFRALLAPPISQDQFELLCPLWSKRLENTKKPAGPAAAHAAEKIILARLDPDLTRWITHHRPPLRSDMRQVLRTLSARIAQQKVATATRNRLSLVQEKTVIDLLISQGWIKLQSRAVDELGAIPTKHFMHKTRFAADKASGRDSTAMKIVRQEVDIACGLKGTTVLAMECKVTNDETNSVKRINDVLKKAVAWKNQWGNFVVTAALLQGVVKPSDVKRLTDANVLVFWSHDLDAFKTWLETQM